MPYHYEVAVQDIKKQIWVLVIVIIMKTNKNNFQYNILNRRVELIPAGKKGMQCVKNNP